LSKKKGVTARPKEGLVIDSSVAIAWCFPDEQDEYSHSVPSFSLLLRIEPVPVGCRAVRAAVAECYGAAGDSSLLKRRGAVSQDPAAPSLLLTSTTRARSADCIALYSAARCAPFSATARLIKRTRGTSAIASAANAQKLSR